MSTVEGYPIERIFQTAHDSAVKKTANSVLLDQEAEDALPKFELSELSRGRVLGRGYFCVVQEITSIRLHSKKAATERPRRLQDERAIYNATQDRNFMEQHYMRENDCRYALKMLQDSSKSTIHDYVNGLMDLATEARFLAVVRHPNIVKMRAMGIHGPFDVQNPYFLVLDRLYDTLTVRLEKWKKTRPSRFFPKKQKEFWVERLESLFDLCTAFQYLHEQNIIYRDLKPDNVGFDVRGDIKLFDFGLAKELHPSKRLPDGMYHLTPDTGSPRYSKSFLASIWLTHSQVLVRTVAPEVALGKPYNATADVYSMSILTWQVLALDPPFLNYSLNMVKRDVYNGKTRPKCDPKWSRTITDALCLAWGSHFQRPTMKQFIEEIRKELSVQTGSYYDGGGDVIDNSHRSDASLRKGVRKTQQTREPKVYPTEDTVSHTTSDPQQTKEPKVYPTEDTVSRTTSDLLEV